ncbi:hypothetical protein [Arthrobacter sp. H5]|uniref:hypothetical protein n=1 Tax=Arthrobacter sp. H5 TaxID=1267973 RepID=UPI00047F1969|nr:hypothetical protein [Arthrobacter sp. H5]
MRTLGSAFFALFALVLGALALPGAWVDANLVAEDGFIELASPLASNPQFTEALTTALAEETTAGVGLPDGLNEIVAPVITEVAGQITGLPEFNQAWDESLRRSHALTFADPRSLPAEADSSSSLTLDIAPVVGLSLQAVGDQLGVEVPQPEQTLINIGQSNQRALLDRLETAASLWPAMAVAAAVGAVLSLLFARRRSTTLALLGVGIVVIGAAYWFLAGLAPGVVERTPDADAVAAVFKDGLTGRAVDSIQPYCLAVAAAGVILLVGGIAGRLLSGPRR